MKKLLISLVSLFFIAGSAFAEPTAKAIATEAARQSSADESVSYIQKQLKSITVPSEKRSSYILLAKIQEQLYYYNDAQKSYAAAAGISAADAEGMPKKTNEQLVIDAVRCALCAGDYETADSYLNSAVRNSKNPEIISYVKLYSQWSSLCRAQTVEDLNEPLELLKAYLKVSSMKAVHPVILLTLWYVTGENSWSDQIIRDFPSSTEAAIVKGDVQLLPGPFWFFVPKSGVAEQGTGTFSDDSVLSASATDSGAATDSTAAKDSDTTVSGTKTGSTAATGTTAKTGSTGDSKNEAGSKDSAAGSTNTEVKFSKWQLGLFKTESNAKLLSDELKGKGFQSYITSETRASGTTYYIVLVNEDKTGNISERLRSAGYDCYPVD